MSRIGKIVRVTMMQEQYPQQWHQERYVGVVTEDNGGNLRILNSCGKVLFFKSSHIFSVEEFLS